MSTQLATSEVQGWSPEQVDLIKAMIAVGCSDNELQLFLYTAKRTGLDPLARQIYAIKRSGRMTIQTGIDGYRVIADRTGKLAGISDYSYDSEDKPTPGRATVTVRKVVDGAIAEFTATARWGEYCAGGPMWQKMPYLMLGKCAEALALRKAFPADLSGVYTAEEMAQADSEPQRQAVEAEVARQKSATARYENRPVLVAGTEDDIRQAIEAPESYVPPELDWMYQKSSGVLICRIVSIVKRKKKNSEDEYLTIEFNGTIDSKKLATYFHKSHQDELVAARSKVCKFMVSASADGKFLNIDEVLEIDGQAVAKEEGGGDPEVKARLLASTLNQTEGDLKVMLTYACGDWDEVLKQLEEVAASREVTA